MANHPLPRRPTPDTAPTPSTFYFTRKPDSRSYMEPTLLPSWKRRNLTAAPALIGDSVTPRGCDRVARGYQLSLISSNHRRRTKCYPKSRFQLRLAIEPECVGELALPCLRPPGGTNAPRISGPDPGLWHSHAAPARVARTARTDLPPTGGSALNRVPVPQTEIGETLAPRPGV